MKRIKFISSMLCMLLAFGTIFGATVSAQENKIGFATVEKQYLAGTTSISNAYLDMDIIKGWDSMEKSINISKYRITFNEFKDYYHNLVYDNPEYFYVKTQYMVSYDEQSKLVYEIYPTYLVSKNKLADYQAKFNTAANKLMSHVKETMGDFSKILTLHDALAMHCQYDENYYLGKEIGDMSYTAYGALVEKNAVCQGYSLAYKLLLDRCSIYSTVATSNEINHMWNVVNLGGQYYHVDVTWDDGRIYSGGKYYDISGRVSHVYFLQTDSEVKNTKKISSFQSSEKATDTKYSNAFFRNANSTNIFTIDGAFYYINKKGEVVKRINNVETALYTIESARWDNTGTSYKIWDPSFAMLGKWNGDLYLNESNSITKISIESEKASKFCSLNIANNESTVGLCVVDGAIYYDKQNSSDKITQLLAGLDYSFEVKITKDGKDVTDKKISGNIGDVYNISVKSVCEIDDSYSISVKNPEIAQYDEEKGTLTLLKEGTVDLTVKSNMSSKTSSVSFTVIDKNNIKLGDANYDGKINMKDVLLIRKYIAGYSLNDFNKQCADVNCDGKINMKDVLLIRKYIAGYPIKFGKSA